MRLDKSMLDRFEHIEPPLRFALTLTVQTDAKLPRDTGMVVYVGASPFFSGGKVPDQQDVLNVATGLRLLDADMLESLRNAVDIMMHAPGGHGYTIDMLEKLIVGQS